MARLSIVFLLTLLSAPLNVIAQSSTGDMGQPAVVFTASDPATVTVPANNGGNGGAGGANNGGSADNGGSGSVTGSDAAAGTGGASNKTVITTRVTGITTEVETIPAQTVSANGTVTTIPEQTVTSKHPFTAEETVTQGGSGAAASSTSTAFANMNANVDVGLIAGWISGIVLFLAAGL